LSTDNARTIKKAAKESNKFARYDLFHNFGGAPGTSKEDFKRKSGGMERR
jgi:hypothetical protein